MWNFKGNLWNSTQNILHIRWKRSFLYNIIQILRALIFKSSYAFLKRPLFSETCYIYKCLYRLEKFRINNVTKKYNQYAGDVNIFVVKHPTDRFVCRLFSTNPITEPTWVTISAALNDIREIVRDFLQLINLRPVCYNYIHNFLRYGYVRYKKITWKYKDYVYGKC